MLIPELESSPRRRSHLDIIQSKLNYRLRTRFRHCSINGVRCGTMEVTEVKNKLVQHSDNMLLAFASITIGRCFGVRDIKIIQGKGSYFVAMPSRKITDHCSKCGAKNHLQASYCNQCGKPLDRARTKPDAR